MKMLNKEKFRKIKVLLTDVDGIMTDGGIYYLDNGLRARKFSMYDGVFYMLQKKGIKCGFCSGERDKCIIERGKKLKVDFLLLGCKDKMAEVSKFLEKRGLSFENLAYIGDDINDIDLMKKAGLAFSVANAMPVAKKKANYVTKKRGGEGAVREIIELFLKYLK